MDSIGIDEYIVAHRDEVAEMENSPRWRSMLSFLAQYVGSKLLAGNLDVQNIGTVTVAAATMGWLARGEDMALNEQIDAIVEDDDESE